MVRPRNRVAVGGAYCFLRGGRLSRVGTVPLLDYSVRASGEEMSTINRFSAVVRSNAKLQSFQRRILELYTRYSPRVKSLLTRRPAATYTVAALLVVMLIVYVFARSSSPSSDVIVSPLRGQFLVTVTTSGELQAKSSINIMGPENARAAYIWQMKITNIVPEGTVVKKGSFVAELDKSEITGKFKDSQLSVQKLDAQYLQTKLDSTLALSQARDEL